MIEYGRDGQVMTSYKKWMLWVAHIFFSELLNVLRLFYLVFYRFMQIYLRYIIAIMEYYLEWLSISTFWDYADNHCILIPLSFCFILHNLYCRVNNKAIQRKSITNPYRLFHKEPIPSSPPLCYNSLRERFYRWDMLKKLCTSSGATQTNARSINIPRS